MNFDPNIAELVRTGATATMILDGVKRLCGLCTDVVLRKIDKEVSNETLTPEKALCFVQELAAYRRIIYRQQQEIEQGRAASRRQAEERVQ